MKLRDHPLVSFAGLPSWPPIWVTVENRTVVKRKGEFGTLLEVRMQELMNNKIFLFIEHNDVRYTGCLLIQDPAFCHQLYRRLQDYVGRPVGEIGNLDLTSTL